MKRNTSVYLRALKETMCEYSAETTLNGFRLLHYVRKRKYQRFFWSIFIVLGYSFGFYVLLVTVTSFLDNPTVTTLSTNKETIWDFPFPALSICSVNKFSHQKIEAFTQKIADLSNKSVTYWSEKMHLLSGYYDESAAEDFDASIEFELELKKIIGIYYNAGKILEEVINKGPHGDVVNVVFFNVELEFFCIKLAPSCEELLKVCYWANVPRNCSELFNMVATIGGHCCMFNHGRKNVKSSSIFYANGTGIEMALVIALNSSTSDYYFKTRSTNGFHMHIFEVNSFPDVSTGEVRELVIPTNSDVTVELSIITQTADEETRQFSVEKRQCFFKNEYLGNEILIYSQSECLSRCRAQSIANLCDCKPYYVPSWPLSKNVSVCSLVNLECLVHYYVTWRTYRPINSERISALLQDALSCGSCYPLCNFNRYYYKKQATKLAKTFNSRLNRKYLSKFSNDTKDISLVKIYFPHQHVTRHNKKVLFNWYQVLSNIGGVIGISIGYSIISAFEWIYFITYRFYINFSKQHKVDTYI